MKNKKKKNELFPLLVTVLMCRFLVPFLLFIQPLVAIPLSLLLDAVDGQLFFNSGYKWKMYNQVDKTLDYWWYVFLLIFLIQKHPQASIIAITLFIVRSLGQFIGVFLSHERAYLLFPNAFEWFAFLIILSATRVEWALVISVVTAIVVELWFHVFKPNLGSKLLFRREIRWKNR